MTVLNEIAGETLFPHQGRAQSTADRTINLANGRKVAFGCTQSWANRTPVDGWDGMGWDGMGWDGMGWDGMDGMAGMDEMDGMDGSRL